MSGSTLYDSIGVVEGLAPLRLTVVGGGCDGRTLTVRSETCVVGSAEDCNLRLAPSAPAYVCEFVRGIDEATVRGRSSHVHLNGEAFDEAPVRPGDRIAIGDVEILVEDFRSNSKNGNRRRLPDTANLRADRGARLEGALLLGELRRLQQELRDATEGTVDRAPIRQPKHDAAQESAQLAESLRTLLESERSETERLRERLDASHRDREELERRVAELDEALQQASERLTEIAQRRESAEREMADVSNANADAARANAEAARAEIDSLRGMLGDAQDELDQMRRVYDARLARAEELAEEERLAAVTRALQEAEERFSAERMRLADLEAESVSALQSRLAELEAQLSTLPEFESQLAASAERLAEVEREAEERLAAAVEETKRETERRLASEMQECVAEELQAAQAELNEQRSELERERREFAEMQLRWDAERSEYERLAAEQTALIAEKQRELRDAQERLAAAEFARAEAPSDSFVDVDRQAWEEEKAAFEELARHRMDELAEKTRQVEERLRAAAEKQRREIQEEREALAREREGALRKSSRGPRLSQYFERTSDEPSGEDAPHEELPEPSFEPTNSEPTNSEPAFSNDLSVEPQYAAAEEPEAPRRGGFRFFGDLSDAPVDATIPIAAERPAEVVEDRDEVAAEEAERLRQIAEDRLARYAPRTREGAAEEELPSCDDREAPVEEPSSEAPASGFLLRDFLNREEPSHEAHEATDATHAEEELTSHSFPADDPPAPSSVAEVLAKFGHSMEEHDLPASVEEHSFDEPAHSRFSNEPSIGAPSYAEPAHAESSHAGPSHAGPTHGGDDEDSIEDYMQSLLRRVRGESAAQLVEPAPQNVRRTAMMRQTTPGVAEPEPERRAEETPVAPLTESEFTPRSEAPEQSERLSAMRALANESTRSAIFSSAVRKNYAKAATSGTLSAASAVLGTGCLWFGAQGNLIVVGAGLLAWGLAGLWGFRAWKTWKELRKLSGPLGGK